MDVSRALAEIAEIHGQLAKGEVYRGYRPIPMAASGAVGLIAAWLRPHGGAPAEFVVYWISAAVLAAAVGGSGMAWRYLMHESVPARRRTRRVVGQFLPSFVAGAIVTVAMFKMGESGVRLLPGLWALFFGVGAFALRPYLPPASTLVATFYCTAGTALLWMAGTTAALSGWWVGATFGAGQLLSAAVLRWSIDGDDA